MPDGKKKSKKKKAFTSLYDGEDLRECGLIDNYLEDDAGIDLFVSDTYAVMAGTASMYRYIVVFPVFINTWLKSLLLMFD